MAAFPSSTPFGRNSYVVIVALLSRAPQQEKASVFFLFPLLRSSVNDEEGHSRCRLWRQNIFKRREFAFSKAALFYAVSHFSITSATR